ncbi:MAG: dTDP-4-dehydrorhamnose 3,5-epimerase [Clostridia bacterium]|nr:dTDP-4-dehydrorhamnose 3,5-epimerase [Clostridia bacterium]
MSNFGIRSAEIEDVKIIEPFFVEDERGYFVKSIEKDVYKSFGLELDIFEEFETYSKKDVIRGLHFQTKNPQTKIVRVITGEVYDVVVDLRSGSPTFGQWCGFELSDKNKNSVWIPAGFAHGFRALSDDVIMAYKCIGKYEKGYDTGIIWNDKTLNIEWGIDNPIVSEKDSKLMSFSEYKSIYCKGKCD